MDLPAFVSELRRRRVVRVLIGYGLVAFAVLQVIEPVVHALHLDEKVLSIAVLLLALGFPVAVALAWAFDLQPGGLERTPPAPGRAGARAFVPVLVLGLAAAVPVVAWLLARAGALPSWSVLAAIMALLVLAIAAVVLVQVQPAASPALAFAGTAPTVAVLPFEDLSPGRDHDWFCSGIAEELLRALCCVSGLRVVSRSSSFQFKGRAVDAREVGKVLGATTLLEGSVRRAGAQVRVDARLVDAEQGIELWGERFDRKIEDTFEVQEEIARAVVRSMRVSLTRGEHERLGKVGASRATRDPRAYELYLRGRHAYMQHGDRMLFEACDLFRQAIALDPTFAQAHAGLADAQVMVLTWNLDPAGADARKADALAAAAEALRLEPDLAEARMAHANVLVFLGRAREADADFRRAVELSPGSGDASYFQARALMASHRHDEAAASFEEAVRRNPDDYASLTLLENVHRVRGDAAGARRAGERALVAVEHRLVLDPEDVRALYLGAGLDLEYGDRERGVRRMERAVELAGDDFSTLYNGACFHLRAGQLDRALDLLDRAVGPAGRGSRSWMEQDPDLDVLRQDPRFQAILARVRG